MKWSGAVVLALSLIAGTAAEAQHEVVRDPTPAEKALLDRVNDPRWHTTYLDENILIAIDTKRVTRISQHHFVGWELLILPKPINADGQLYDESKSKVEFDCSEGSGRKRVFTRTYYLGRNIGTTETFNKPEWQDTVPDTTGEAAHEVSCEYFRARSMR